MAGRFPPDIDDFVRAELAAGDYPSENALVIDALRALRELKLRYQDLLDELRQAVAQADAGELHALDTEATKAEAARRLAARRPAS